MKTQLFAVLAFLGAMGASLTPEQHDQGETNLLANVDEQKPIAAMKALPFPFSDPHTIEPRGLQKTSSASTELSAQSQDPVSDVPHAETPSMAGEDTSTEAENAEMTDCVTSNAPLSPSPSVNTPTNSPQLSSEVGGSSMSDSDSPCPESSQESGPTLAPEIPEGGFGDGDESSHVSAPAPTEDFSFPAGGAQVAPTASCASIIPLPASSQAANQSLTTIVVQPVGETPSTTLPVHHSETQPLPKATETGPIQVSAGSRSWTVGAPTTVFSIGLLGGWLVV